MSDAPERGGPVLWPWMVGAMALISLGLNATLIWVAYASRPDLERPDYYQAGLDYQAEIDERRASEPSWRHAVEATRAGLRACLHEGEAPLSGARVRAWLRRPDDASADRAITLEEGEGGCYRAALPLRAGAWRLLLRAERGEAHARFEERLWVP